MPSEQQLNVPGETIIPLLLRHHKQLIKDSAIAEDVALARGYESVINPAELQEYGFSKAQRLTPTLLIPSWGVRGSKSLHIHRPDKPRVGKKGKAIKYESPSGAPTQIDCHPFCREALKDPSRPLYITEGIRKGDAAVSAGLCVIALLGVWNWRGQNEYGGKTALADWDYIALNGREVFIVFDSDVMQNREVYVALYRLKGFLQGRGAKVYAIYLEPGPQGEKVGLDDFLAAHQKAENNAGAGVKKLLDMATEELREPEGPDETQPIGNYNLTDLGNAERLADAFHTKLRYVADWKESGWLYYDGLRWATDRTGQVIRFAKEVIRKMYQEAAELENNDDRKLLAQHAHKSESERAVRAMIHLAQSDKRIAAVPEDFDTDKMMLNVLNGTLNLETSELEPHNPDHMITMLAPVWYDPDATAPEIEEFLVLVTKDNREMIDYLQRVAGYCLTGDTKEGAIFYIAGFTRTGKSTFVQMLMALLGDYAWKTSFDTFLSQRRGGGARDDIAAMQNKRLVVASEVSHGSRFNEAVLKELTGEDSINARQLYRRATVFQAHFKLMFAANDFPFVRNEDTASWARFQKIMFDNPEAADRKYLQLKHDVRDMDRVGSALLNWALQGCLLWQKEDSLKVPEEVINAVKEQRDEFDPLAEWEQEHIDKGDTSNHVELFSLLWDSYQMMYAGDHSTHTLGRTGFSRALLARGYVLAAGSPRRFRGLKLRASGQN